MDEFTIGIGTVKWELIVLACLLVIAVVLACRKRFKRAIAFFVISSVILAVETLARCTVLLAMHNPAEAIRLGVAWAPTVLFVVIIIFSTALGVWRGFRKSAILMLHAVCSAAVCIGLFFFCVNSEAVDKGVLSLVNLIAGDIRNTLGVSSSCSTMREVFAEWLPSLFPYGSELNLVLADNGAYLITLADMVYRIAFGLILGMLYQFLLLILYIIYRCAYSERKYKRRKELAVKENKTDRAYCAHRVSGGVVGLVRGLVAGLISMAFLGTAFFMVAGTGQNRSPDFRFSDGNADFAYSAFQSVENYGSQGIFRILNAARDSDGQPYYLFAADLIFSGRLDDELNDVHANIKFRKEIGAYTDFARETWDLMLRYGGDGLAEAINGNGDIKEAVLTVFENERFRTEFEDVIDGFDTQTYFINFALSAATTIVNNIEETSLGSSMSESTRELMKVMFKPGYLSPVIPDEYEMLQRGEEGEQPYIGLPQLYSKEDTKIYYKMVVSFLTKDGETDTLSLVRSLLPQMQQLSILSGKRADKLDPVFGRLYCYLANQYLKGEEDASGVRYKDVAKADVKWTDEINTLIDTVDDAFKIYDACKEDGEINLDSVLSLFDADSEHYLYSQLDYVQTMKSYNTVAENLSSSQLLEQVLSTGYMYETLKGLFTSVSQNIYVPRDIRYTDNGEQLGELKQLMYGLKLLGNKENRESIKKLTEGEDAELADIFELMSNAAKFRDGKGNTLSDYMSGSVYLRSLISSVMLDQSDMLYIPDVSLEKSTDGKPVRLIKSEVIKQLFTSLADETVHDPLLNFVRDEEASISELLTSDAIANILCNGNGIIEGTVAKQMVKIFDADEYKNIVIPNSLKLIDGEYLPDKWLTQDGIPGELNKLVTALRLDGADADTIMDTGHFEKDILKHIIEQNENAAQLLMNSEILQYTMSKAVIDGKFKFGNGLELVVPTSVIHAGDGERVIASGEMQSLLDMLVVFDFGDDSTSRNVVNVLINNVDRIADSAIICASTANYVVNNKSKLGNVVIPQKYYDAGQKDALTDKYQNVELWQKELASFAAASDILFAGDSEIEINNKLISSLTGGSLHTVYSSKLVAATITDRIKSEDIPVTDHPGAYEYDTDPAYTALKEIYRESEVSALLEVLGGADLENFELKQAEKYKGLIYDNNGNTSSYLLAATLSDKVLENGSFIVPANVLDGSDIIMPKELSYFIDAFLIYNGGAEEGLEDWTPQWNVPSKDVIPSIAKSDIVRATITDVIEGQYGNSGKAPYISYDNIEIKDRVLRYEDSKDLSRVPNGAISVSESQMSAILSLLSGLGGDKSSFLLPEINTIDDVLKLAESAEIEDYLACDELRYDIGEQIYKTALGFAFTEQGAAICARYSGHEEKRIALIKGNTDYQICNCFTVGDAIRSIDDLRELMENLGFTA